MDSMMRMKWCFSLIAAGGCGLMAAAESFEASKPGRTGVLETALGKWTAEGEVLEVHSGHAKEGRQSLRLTGAEGWVVLELAEPTNVASRLSFWSERWTSRGPFEFRIEASVDEGDFKEVWQGDKQVKVGGFLTKVEVPLPEGAKALRFRCTAPANSGVMMDLLDFQEEKPMRLLETEVVQPVVPVLVRKGVNPVLGLKIPTEGALEPLQLEAVEVEMTGTTRLQDVAAVSLISGGPDPSGGFGESFDEETKAGRIAFSGSRELTAGDNWFWVSVRLKDDADIDGRVDAQVTRLKISGKVIELANGNVPGSQRIGVGLRLLGDDGSKAYRIPGMARTNKGTLIAVYDIRYTGGHDLPGDIDVGVSRSTDAGRNWEPMKVAMDMGRDRRHAYDGVGDPCVFVDRVTGRIWIAALWSHGNRAWNGSGPGLKPEETGQLVLVWSDDDGKTWSKPRNITEEVKDPAWRLLLDGPGTGITMRDGTLVFPAQYRAADGKPWSTLIWSADRGETWKIGSGVKSDTTEAQLIELADGSIMINCRDNRGGARTVAVTRDLGKTWALHPTDRKALPESVCMASLLNWDVPGVGPRLFFSNPATTSGRHTMTIKVSADEGMTWPETLHTIYDKRSGAGYSCLAPADDKHLGILYEGPLEMYFLRIPVAELLDPASADRQ
jgi:sialidase-1